MAGASGVLVGEREEVPQNIKPCVREETKEGIPFPLLFNSSNATAGCRALHQ